MTNFLRRLPTMAAALGAASLLAAGAAQAGPMALIDPGLSGTTEYSAWTSLRASDYPGGGTGGFPGNTMWAPLAAQAGDAGATLNKLGNGSGGGPYLASSSIYFGGFSGDINNNGGTLAVVDTAVLDSLDHITFQIQFGEAWTYDFWNGVMPTLSYNGGSQNLASTSYELLEAYFNGTVDMPTGPEDVYINTHRLDWDLSGVADPITSISISFTGVQHAQLYQLRVDQAAFAPAAVPEPASMAMLACGIVPVAGALIVRRKRARA